VTHPSLERLENDSSKSLRTQIGMFRPIRMDHTNCLQVAIKSIQFLRGLKVTHQKINLIQALRGLKTRRRARPRRRARRARADDVARSTLSSVSCVHTPTFSLSTVWISLGQFRQPECHLVLATADGLIVFALWAVQMHLWKHLGAC
jgi:hypothetical protein